MAHSTENGSLEPRCCTLAAGITLANVGRRCAVTLRVLSTHHRSRFARAGILMALRAAEIRRGSLAVLRLALPAVDKSLAFVDCIILFSSHSDRLCTRSTHFLQSFGILGKPAGCFQKSFRTFLDPIGIVANRLVRSCMDKLVLVRKGN